MQVLNGWRTATLPGFEAEMEVAETRMLRKEEDE